MKNIVPICIVVFTIFTSCKKDTPEFKVVKKLTINEESHTFINEDGKHFFSNTLTSQQESHRYKLEMIKDVEYRISTSQPEALNNQTNLTLVNSVGDTLAYSQIQGNSKYAIVLKSPQTTDYYLIVNLLKLPNPKFEYRLYFEIIDDKETAFSGFDWKYSGTWTITDSVTAELTNCDSRIYRHLRLTNPVEGNPDMSFIIQSNSLNPNFGLIMDASDDLFQNGEYAYELTSSGYVFLAFKEGLNFTVMTVNSGTIYFEWSSLTNIDMNFSTGIKVDLKYLGTQYAIYLNNTFLRTINGSLSNLYILVEDSGDGTTIIKDFQLIR